MRTNIKASSNSSTVAQTAPADANAGVAQPLANSAFPNGLLGQQPMQLQQPAQFAPPTTQSPILTAPATVGATSSPAPATTPATAAPAAEGTSSVRSHASSTAFGHHSPMIVHLLIWLKQMAPITNPDALSHSLHSLSSAISPLSRDHRRFLSDLFSPFSPRQTLIFKKFRDSSCSMASNQHIHSRKSSLCSSLARKKTPPKNSISQFAIFCASHRMSWLLNTLMFSRL